MDEQQLRELKMTKLREYQNLNNTNPRQANRLLFQWLCDSTDRKDLYSCLRKDRVILEIQSRADVKENLEDERASKYNQNVYLITAREHVIQAFENSEEAYSNSPFQALGSGNFMLGLDQGIDHTAQREFAASYLKFDSNEVLALCAVSFRVASVLPLKKRNFDLAELAGQAALRFVGFLFGFAQADQVLLEPYMQKAANALSYQTFARHFATDPAVIPENSKAMAALAKRVAELIDLYQTPIGTQQLDEHKALNNELAELNNFKSRKNEFPLKTFRPILRRMGECRKPGQPDYSTNELAVIVVGLIAGTVSNVQSGVVNTIDQFFRSEKNIWTRARDAAVNAYLIDGLDAGEDKLFTPFVQEALRLNPPVAFLPRKTLTQITLGETQIPKEQILILAIGAATRDIENDPDEFDETRKCLDPLIFGSGPIKKKSLHQCLGDYLALPLITHITRQTMLLSGLSEAINPRNGMPYGLQKQWGYHALSYPLDYQRSALLKQSALCLVMKIKTPLATHAEELKRLIEHGAPAITINLMATKHFHFGFFTLLENDSKLAFIGVYDQDLDSYIERLDEDLGPLLEPVFAHIQDAPPLPTNTFPKEFADAIRRYQQRPVGDYFFSAYPQVQVADILQQRTQLKHQLSTPLKQSPLYVVMNVKMPIAEHAEALKKVIKYGAARIEKKLMEAKHVHFAFFMFQENDSKLALCTVYDRDFDSYIEHFALEIGVLFDRIFEHIQDAPQLPVDEFPKEFVDAVRRYNQSPVGGYFFSAYPQTEVAYIQHHFSKTNHESN